MTLTADAKTVYESGLLIATVPDSQPTTVSGNLLANDDIGDLVFLPHVSSVDGHTADSNGVINFSSPAGDLTVYTEDYDGHNAGDYSYTLENPTLEGSTDSEEFTYTVTNSQGTSESSTLTISIVDDAPVVNATPTVIAENDGDFTVTDFLPVRLPADETDFSWDLAASTLPNLVYDGKTVTFTIDNTTDTLTGVAGGVDIFKITVDMDPTTGGHQTPTYKFELLEDVGELGVVTFDDSVTNISGGNTGLLDLQFGDYLVDSMSATSDANGNGATVNTNNGWIGVDGNWFDDDDVMTMDFVDVDNNPGEVSGLSIAVQGGAGGQYTYEVHWTVTAAIDDSGTTVTYDGTHLGTGNDDEIFDIPMQNGALYLTQLQIESIDINLQNGKNNSFRIAIAGVQGNDYVSDLDMNFAYNLTDADGDSATGAIDVTLTGSQTTILPGDHTVEGDHTASIVDGIVEGLYYQTSAGVSGYTDANGHFDYLDADVVTFKLGNIEIGSVDMKNIEDGKVFLQDIANVDRTNVNDEYVENMAVLLQSLDSDSGDNIVITEEMHEVFADEEFDLATISEEDLIAVIEDNGLEAVSEDDAMEHVQDMLEEYTDLEESEFDERTEDEVEEGILVLNGEEDDSIDMSVLDEEASDEVDSDNEESEEVDTNNDESEETADDNSEETDEVESEESTTEEDDTIDMSALDEEVSEDNDPEAESDDTVEIAGSDESDELDDILPGENPEASVEVESASDAEAESQSEASAPDPTVAVNVEEQIPVEVA